MQSTYEKAKERLAKLPRAERFEELIKFPTRHTFKVIGKPELKNALQGALERMEQGDTLLVERPSAKGTYLSLTFTLSVDSGEELDGIYCALERLPGLLYLL